MGIILSWLIIALTAGLILNELLNGAEVSFEIR